MHRLFSWLISAVVIMVQLSGNLSAVNAANPDTKLTSDLAATSAVSADLYTRKEIIYRRLHGAALSFTMFTPSKNSNAAAVVQPLSEGWYSDYDMIERNIDITVLPLN
jgi:hypothetical protein